MKFKKTIAQCLLLSLGMLFVLSTLQAQDRPRGGQGQGRGGDFDPAQFMDRMMERYQEQLEFKDEEWKAIRPLVEDITTKQREARAGGRGLGGFGAFGGGARGGDGAGRGGDGGGRRGGFGGADNPAADALHEAVESNADASVIKAKLEAYRKDRVAKEDALKKAQDKFRAVLTMKQEGQAVLMGLVE